MVIIEAEVRNFAIIRVKWWAIQGIHLFRGMAQLDVCFIKIMVGYGKCNWADDQEMWFSLSLFRRLLIFALDWWDMLIPWTKELSE